MIVATLLALAAVPGWLVGAPGGGDRLLVARQHDGEQVTRYGPASLTDVDDAPLELWAYDPGRSPYPAPPRADTTVHGQPAEYSTLTDEGQAYGRALRWVEPSGVTLELNRDGRPSDARLRAMAESVSAVPPERWQALQVATGDTPALGHLPPGMPSVVVRRGRAGGHRWALAALLPPGFPVAPEDRRAACYRLAFRGRRAYGFNCADPTSWKRVAGTIFVFGEVPARVRRVRVLGAHGIRVTAATARAPGYPLASFYAAPLPSRACEVRVEDAGRHGAAAVIGPTGPAVAGSRADRGRCRRR